MIRNPIHKRLEKLESWQQMTFMACLCERMYPNYQVFCLQSAFCDPTIYRKILDLVWETLLVKDARVNFDSQLEKLEDAIPQAEQFDIYAVYPAIDACIGLGEAIHAILSGEMLEHAITLSEISLRTVAMYEMTKAGYEMTDDQLKALPEIEDELDIQWEIYRLLIECETRDLALIKGLREDIRAAAISNIGIPLGQF